MDGWLDYELFGNVLESPPAALPHGLSSEGMANLARIERRIAGFYAAHRQRVTGLYVTHYHGQADDHLELDVDGDVGGLRKGRHVEFIRVRLRVDPGDTGWATAAFRAEVIEPLGQGSGPLKAWRLGGGYTARGDVGTRFGDPAHGVDTTEPVVKILTGCTELRFALLDHPEFAPNHDIIHLYFNILGLFYPQEAEALEARARRVRGFMAERAAPRGRAAG